ncbi:hypothetical protein CCMA1212_009321 [Trichoderma ghanense]|uniref:Uncharacterized protein n=1 Tax=Trichoderma ghanense TaxID=65468 RepID=A0ABY2GSM2_9HYPO
MKRTASLTVKVCKSGKQLRSRLSSSVVSHILAEQLVLDSGIAGQSAEIMEGSIIFDHFLGAMLIFAIEPILTVQSADENVSASVKTALANLLEISFNLGYYPM